MFKSCGRLLDSTKDQTLTEPFLLVKKLWFASFRSCSGRMFGGRNSKTAPVFGSVHLPINPDTPPCCCRGKAKSQHDAATSMLHSVDGVFQLTCSVSSKLEGFFFFFRNLTPLSTSPQLHPLTCLPCSRVFVPFVRKFSSDKHLRPSWNSCVYTELGRHTGEL